jgi:N-acetylglucosaminyl-diphospho-decaprenol L-rhamnosyltransferase
LTVVGDAPRWAAVIVNYNAGAHLVGCVRSLLADDSAGTPEIVVVDNASSDGSLDALASLGRAVSIVHSGSNRGLAGGANLGIAATRASIVAVLNPDTAVRRGSAAVMIDCFETAPARGVGKTGVAGPRIDNPDGSIYPSARREPGVVASIGHALLGTIRPNNRFTRRYRELDSDPTVARDVDWLSGAALWFRRDALDAVGGWDERYFMFMEDVDICRRLRAEGWRVRYEPAASVVHVEGVSRSHHPYRMIAAHHRSAWRFASRHWRGARRWLLPLAAPVLAIRAVLTMMTRWLGGRRKAEQVGG